MRITAVSYTHLSENCPFDLLILDIQMDGMTGMELARSLREKGNRAVSYTHLERDNVVKMLTERLSHLGITEAQAENAYAYLDEVEKNLCVIDGIRCV